MLSSSLIVTLWRHVAIDIWVNIGMLAQVNGLLPTGADASPETMLLFLVMGLSGIQIREASERVFSLLVGMMSLKWFTWKLLPHFRGQWKCSLLHTTRVLEAVAWTKLVFIYETHMCLFFKMLYQSTWSVINLVLFRMRGERGGGLFD